MSDWNQFRGDPQRSGLRRDLEGPERVTEAWTADLAGAVGSPVLDRDTVFVGTDRGNCYALETETGRRRWTVETTAATDPAPVVTRDALYFGTDAGTVHAVDPATGEPQWETAVPDAIESALAYAGDRLYVGHAAGVSALDPATGELEWTHETDTPVGGSPAVAEAYGRGWDADRLFVGTEYGAVYALEADSGEEIWAAPTDGAVTAGPTVVDDRVYVGDDDGTMIAMAVENGQSWFTYEIADAFTVAPTVLADVETTFIGAADGYLHVTDTTFGRRKLRGWLFSKKGVALDGPVRSSPIVGGEILLVGDATGSLYGVDIAADCDLEWHVDLESAVTGTPALADGRAFVGNEAGRLTCLEW